VNETSGESAWNPIIWPFKFTFVIAFVLLLLQVIVEVLKNILTLLGYKVPDPLPVEGLNSTNPNESNPLIPEEILREPR
jgi:TRAP-type mannitol/chloroaromatic compound transport system permease small subunit